MRVISTTQAVGAAVAQTAGILLMLTGHRPAWDLGNVLVIISTWILLWGDKTLSRPVRANEALVILGVLAATAALIVAAKMGRVEESALAGREWVFFHPTLLLPLWALMLLVDVLCWRKGRQSSPPTGRR